MTNEHWTNFLLLLYDAQFVGCFPYKPVVTLNKHVADNYEKDTSDIGVKGIAISGNGANHVKRFLPRAALQTMPAFLVVGVSAAIKYTYFFPYNIS